MSPNREFGQLEKTDRETVVWANSGFQVLGGSGGGVV